MRLAFEFMSSVNRPSNVGGHHSVHWGPKKNQR